MRNVERPSTLIVIVVTLALAGLIGLAVPLASGSKPGKAPAAWSSPTPAPPTTSAPTVAATATAAPAPTQTATRPPSATFAPPLPSVTSTPDLSPSPTPTAQAQATQQPLPTATPPPSPSATQRAPVSATRPALSPGAGFGAAVAVDLLNLRGGPGQGFGVIGLARAGETFTVTARSEDGAWLQICCVNRAPAWLATGMVTVTGAIEGLPVAP